MTINELLSKKKSVPNAINFVSSSKEKTLRDLSQDSSQNTPNHIVDVC